MARRTAVLARVLCAASMVALAADARANGVFPSSGHLVLHPGDPSSAWIRMVYGVVLTRDGGASWSLLCQPALGYALPDQPTIAVTPSGSLWLGLPDGAARGSADGCGYDRVPSLEGLRVEDISQTLAGPAYAVVTMQPEPHRVYRTDDGAQTFAATAAPLPLKFQPLTLDAAPSNPDRVYVSGLTGEPPELVGAFARSNDAGASWTEVFVPGSTLATAPYIGAVDPSDELRVYVRLDGAPGRLLVTEDGGDSWEEIFQGEGFLRGFAVSQDGEKAFVGGEADGIWRAAVPDFAFQKITAKPVRCLRAGPDALYACMLPQQGYQVGRSIDDGATFVSYYEERCLDGPLACDPSTPVGARCPAVWPDIAQQVGARECGEGGAGGAAATAASASSTSGSAQSGVTGAGGSGGADGGLAPSGGCGCGVPAAGGPHRYLRVAALFGLFAVAHRLTYRRARKPPTCR
jgi:photosystem II stability/assembly factor-like uncharacterized protein